MCLKRPITTPFERSEPFHLLRLMGVSVPSLHIESTDSMITRDFMIDTYHISHKVYYTDPELGILMAYIDIQLHNGVLNVTRNTTNVVKASLWHGQNIL